MSDTHAQVQFAAEFVTLMVAAAGLAVAALRPIGLGRRTHPWRRVLTAGGFLATATVAFLHGSLLLTGNPGGAVSLTRLAGAAALAASLGPWSSDSRRAPWYLAGLLGWAAAGVVELAQAPSVAVDILLVAGSLIVGAALLDASRRAIAARVAAAAAATLLAVIVVLAVALSTVISSSLQHDELKRLGSQAAGAAAQLDSSAITSVAVEARFAALHVGRSPRVSVLPVLQQAESVDQRIGLAYDGPGGVIAAVPSAPPGVAAAAATAASVFAPPRCGETGQGDLVVSGQAAWAAANYPLCEPAGGAVLALLPFDRSYLTTSIGLDATTSVALVTGHTVLAGSEGPPAKTDPSALVALAAVGTGTRAIGNAFLAAAPLKVTSAPSGVTLVLSTPNTTVLSARTQLYRTLFLIALGGTVLALGLAAITGDRITAGLRRLTEVAARIERGEGSQRAAIPGHDEVARLGSAFDAMVGAVEEQAVALQAAADDETRLRNRLEAVVAGMNDALIAVDATGRVTEMNQAAEALLGRPAVQARGRAVTGVLTLVAEDGTDLAARLGRPAEEPWGEVGTVVGGASGDVPVAVSAGTLRGPAGELAGQVVVIRDLRREHEVERMKTEFLSRIGHELRTPLTGIMGYADILLRREVPPERAREWHEEILQAGRRLLRIVEMLEFFASSGASRVLLRPEPLDTRALVHGLTASWSERLPDNVTLGRRVARSTPMVMADRRWISMALDELIDNAVKFSPDGGRIVVGAEPGATSNGGPPQSVDIFVADRGVGMSPEDSASVFTDFVQADGSDTRRFGGLGLGLAVVRRVVEGHGGEVHCRSEAGRGTTFTVTLPSPTQVPPQS